MLTGNQIGRNLDGPALEAGFPTVTIQALQDLGFMFHERGWSLGTSSNYSIVLDRDPFRLLITASGRDKRHLGADDFVVVDDRGQAVLPAKARPSAETLLHVVAAHQSGVGAVLHTHSVWATVLSDFHHGNGGLAIEGYEMLKGLAGVTTHEYSLWLEILENSQDISALAGLVRQLFANGERPLKHGFLLRRHGLYTWGRDLDEARRHVEILEFLLEVMGQSLALTNFVGRPSQAALK